MLVFTRALLSKMSLALLGFGLLGSVGCSSLGMPAITDTPTRLNLPGKVVWHDLITDTPEASKAFYAELFGWEYEQVNISLGWFQSLDYSLIRQNGRLIGGMVDQMQLQSANDVSQWVSLISVADIDAAVQVVEAGGGRVLTPALDLEGRGRLAVALDPQGALFSLLQTDTGDPPDQPEPAPGDFLWSELWTDDVDSASVFYRHLAGYGEADYELIGNHYRILSSQGEPRVGIMKIPLQAVDPVWVNYLRVADSAALDSIVARVEALGGSILLDPQEREIGGRVALIAGPSGAGIALQTWPFDTRD